MDNGIMAASVGSTTSKTRRLLAGIAATTAALILSPMALASGEYFSEAGALAPTLETTHQTEAELAQQTADGQPAGAPLYLDAAPAAAPPEEKPNVHGFFNSPFMTAYVTPRGLVVQNKGLVWQPIVGLVFPLGDAGPIKDLTFVGGIWNSVDTYEEKSNPFTGAWDEMDIFTSFSGTVADVISLNLTYGAWNSPEHAFKTEHNLDLQIGYEDGKLWGDSGFSLNPYVDCWWAISGSSTVILGRHGGTGYFQPGIVPTYTLKAIPNQPITIKLPIYTSVGPKNYWDGTGSFKNSPVGLVSAGLSLSTPASFIPVRYGHWHIDAGVTYDYLANDALLAAGGLASGNTERNVVIGSVGFGVGF